MIIIGSEEHYWFQRELLPFNRNDKFHRKLTAPPSEKIHIGTLGWKRNTPFKSILESINSSPSCLDEEYIISCPSIATYNNNNLEQILYEFEPF